MAYEVLSICHNPKKVWYSCYAQWLRSLDRHSMRPVFVPGEWRGMTSKIKNLYRYLDSGKHTGSHVIFTDCFDLVFGNPSLKRPNDLWPMLMERFKSFNAPIVFNAEKNCFPFPELALEFDKLVPEDIKSPFKYLNSGFFIAETDALMTLLRYMRPNDLPNDGERQDYMCPGDQDYYSLAFLQQPVPMKLDYDGLLCTALHGVQLDELVEPVVGEPVFHQACSPFGPMAFHFNGEKRGDVMSKILKTLRL